jgi:hypothetical protein
MIRATFAAIAVLAISTPALAGPFDGTWKADMSTFKASAKPYTRLLANGHYHCTCSTPPEDFAADGKFHAVTGHPGYDEAMGAIVDARTVRLAYKLKGHLNAEVISTVSADGKTVTDKWTDTSSPHTVTGEAEEIRVEPAPKGAHAISGAWRDSNKMSISATGMSVTIAQAGDALKVSSTDGTSYTAVIGGPAVKISGSAAGGMMALSRQGPHTLVASYSHGGKVLDRDVWTFNPDGKTVVLTSTNLASERTQSMTAVKQ